MSIQKKSNGYQVRWRDGNVHRAKTFPSKAEALKFKASLILKEPEDYIQPMTFYDLAKQWFEQVSSVQNTSCTSKSERSRLNAHLLPFFGDRYLTEITTQEFFEFRTKLSARNLSKATINQITILGRTILEFAVTNGYLKENPWTTVKCFTLAEQPFDYWSRDEIKKFLEWSKVHDPKLHEIVTIAVFTGLRRSEISGLLRDSVDYDRGFISVHRTYSEETKKVYDETKNKKKRIVPANASVMEILRRKQGLHPKDRLFTLRLNQISERLCGACVKAGVHIIRFHDLRHTFASQLVMSGVDIYTVSKLLGHSSITMTQRYAHLSDGYLQGVTDVLDENVRANVRAKSQDPKIIDLSERMCWNW